MRFNRAAKVAALPLLAMVLVVALVACQGPAGPAGKDATADGTDGTDGMIGPMGINALNPKAWEDVIFNDKVTPAVFMAADAVSVDLDPYFVGGNRNEGIIYTMSPLPLPSGLTPAAGVAIKDNELVVTPTDETAPTVTNDANPYRNVHVIIRATDADGRIADNVIAIRRNKAPTGSGDPADIRIGTQPTAIMAADQERLFGAALTNWTCSSFNTCTLNLAAANIMDDPNDTLMYSATPADSDSFSVAAPAMGITLTGKAATAAAVTIITNAIDTGDLVIVDEEDRPEFDLTVDAQPTKVKDIADVVLERYGVGGIQYVGRAATAGLPAFFMDPEEQTLMFTFTYDDATIVNARLGTEFDHDGDPDTSMVQPIELRSLNVGTAVVTVRATEPIGGTNGIGQYVEGKFTVTVNP